jgi:hypothetical protein
MAKVSFLILFVWSVKRNSNANTGKIKKYSQCNQHHGIFIYAPGKN